MRNEFWRLDPVKAETGLSIAAISIEQGGAVNSPLPIRAELIGSDKATSEGITARGQSPVTMLCRQLIAAGFDPDRPLEAYRGQTLCLKVRSLADGGRLTVREGDNEPPRFTLWKPWQFRAVAPPIAPISSPQEMTPDRAIDERGP